MPTPQLSDQDTLALGGLIKRMESDGLPSDRISAAVSLFRQQRSAAPVDALTGGLPIPNAAAQAQSSLASHAIESMQLDNPYNFTDNSGGNFWDSTKDAFVGAVKGIVHLPTFNETSPTGTADSMKDLPAATVGRVADQAQAGNYGGAAGTVAGTVGGIAAPMLAMEGLNLGVRAGGRLLKAGAESLPDARNAAADSLRTSAEKNIATALNPTTKVNKALVRDKLAPGIIDRGITATSLADLQSKAQAGMETHGQTIDDIFDAHAEAGTKLSPKPILDALDAEKQNYIVDGEPINPAYVNKIQAMQDQLQRVSDANGGEIPLASLRRIRQINDEVVANSKGAFALPPDEQSIVAAHKTYGNAIRSTFAENVPDLADANREFNFYSNLDKVTGDSLLRKTGQRAPLTQKILEATGTGVGASVGGPFGAIVGKEAGAALGRLQHSTIWNTFSAQTKARIASLIGAGDEAGALNVAIRNGVVQESVPEAAGSVPQSRGVSTNDDTGATGQGAPIPGPIRASGGAGAETTGGQGGGIGSNDTVITVPGEAGNRYKAQYTVKELSDIQPSHNGQTFQPNPQYALKNDRNYANAVNQGKVVAWSSPVEFDPKFHITDNPDASNGPIVTDQAGNVLGGNGRAMIMQRVYKGNPKGAAAYRDLLANKAAQFGIDPATLKGMKQPVLTREIPDVELATAQAKQKAVTDFNKKGTAELTPAERAIADSRRVSPATLESISARLDEKGADSTLSDVLQKHSGIEILNKLIEDGVISPQERAAFTSEDALTTAGKDRISKLMLARFFDDPHQLDTIPASVRNQLERVAAPLAQVDGRAGWSLSHEVGEALDILDQAHKRKVKTVDEFLKYDGLFGATHHDPKAVAIASAMQTMKADELRAAFRQYAQDANYASKGANTLMGDAPTPESAFADAFPEVKPEAKPKNALAPKK